MKLLKNVNEYNGWYLNNQFLDIQNHPSEFPCYVYEEVISWGMEESRAIFLYEGDLKNMIKEIRKNK